jgi:hypothetical protein
MRYIIFAFFFSSIFSKRDKASRACGNVGKSSTLLGETFPSGGGNPRFVRISTGAAFPSGHVSFYPQILLKNQKNHHSPITNDKFFWF